MQNLIGNRNFEITAEIIRAYEAVARKYWSSDHEPSNSCCQTNNFIAKKIYNKLKEYIDDDDVASMEKFADLLDIYDYTSLGSDWIRPYSSETIIEPHADDVEYTDNLLYYTIDKDSEDIFKFLISYLDYDDYGHYSDGREKIDGDIILLFPDTEKALKYANLYVNSYINLNYEEEEITDKVPYIAYGLCCYDISPSLTDPFILALDAGKIEIFKWCLDNTTPVPDEGYPAIDLENDFYNDAYKHDNNNALILDQISPYTYISQQCNNGESIYCEAKEYSEQLICDATKKFPEWYELSDFEGLELECN